MTQWPGAPGPASRAPEGASAAPGRGPTVCLTLDLEPDYGGRLEPAYAGWEPERVGALMALLTQHGAKLTAFVVGESLKARPRVIDVLREHEVEFHLHSFSHDLKKPDSLDEISRGSEAFAQVFGHRPEGYRAPEGRISPEGWRRLELEGFRFDSSIFPSFWPAPRYLRYPNTPFRPEGLSLLELPISTLGPLRIIVSLSWMKLLGWTLYRPLLERASWPEPLVFDMHLHDLWALPSFDKLGRTWRLIYSRNHEDGLRTLSHFLDLLAAKGRRFATLGAVARQWTRVPALQGP